MCGGGKREKEKELLSWKKKENEGTLRHSRRSRRRRRRMKWGEWRKQEKMARRRNLKEEGWSLVSQHGAHKVWVAQLLLLKRDVLIGEKGHGVQRHAHVPRWSALTL